MIFIQYLLKDDQLEFDYKIWLQSIWVDLL